MSVQSKHILNSPATLVVESLKGLCDVNSQLTLDARNKIVFVKSHDRQKVALLCGGGSGHEPAHAGFVGQGILTGAVCGNVFASPNASQVRRGIDLVDNDKGTVIIVKNYTGDVLNFGLAKEQYAAQYPDKSQRLRFVIVGDDVAVGRAQGKIVGRRGLAGTVLVYKIAGALADRSSSLDEVHYMAEYISNHIATIGVSLGHTHVPGTAPLASDLSLSQIEIGMGIHNESGHNRLSPIPALSDLIPQLLDLLTSTTDPDRSFVQFKGKDSIVLLVNNLGGISELEIGGVVAETRRELETRGFNIERILSGTFMTSLNMPGFSLTLLLLPTEDEKDAPRSDLILSLLDDTPAVPGWKRSVGTLPLPKSAQVAPSTKDATMKSSSLRRISSSDTKGFLESFKRAAKALIDAEPEITRMDSIAGDGDCGLTLKTGAEAVLEKINKGEISGDDIIRSVIVIAEIAEDSMGGTSGALYSIFFSGLAQGLQSNSVSDCIVTPELWSRALTSALANLYTYTRARPPSRTLVDPLAAFIGSYSATKSFAEATATASKAAEVTKNLEAKAGRSAYVQGDQLIKDQVPDPGAWGVKTILEHLAA